MTDGFWTMVGVVLPVLIVQIFQYLATKRNAEKAAAGREEIKAQVCEVKDHLTTVSMQAVRSKDEVDMAHRSGVRSGYIGGIEEGKRQATDFGQIGK